MMVRIWVALVAMMLAPAAGAETLVRLNAPVSDAEFHRAVACAAKPGGPCRAELVRWGRRTRTDLRVALLPADPGYPAERSGLVVDALEAAIRQINGAGAGLKLRRVAPDMRPHILVTRSALKEGERTRGVPNFPDGDRIGVGRFQIWWNDDRVLQRAGILISSDINPNDIRSVMLEELVQSLGLWHDIEGAGYAGRSIFDENSNAIETLTGQDLAILRLHYPP